jgi:hypothetical protein
MIARENPFRTERVHALPYRPPEGGLEALAERFDAMGRRGALVGPQGSGKTTLLENLVPEIAARGHPVRRIDLDREPGFFDAAIYRPFFESLAPGTVVILDSAEKLGRWRWRAFERESRRAGGLLITTHNPGFLPTLLACRASPLLLEELVRELVGADAETLPLGPLYDLHQGNLRLVLRSLYDLYAGRA